MGSLLGARHEHVPSWRTHLVVSGQHAPELCVEHQLPRAVQGIWPQAPGACDLADQVHVCYARLGARQCGPWRRLMLLRMQLVLQDLRRLLCPQALACRHMLLLVLQLV